MTSNFYFTATSWFPGNVRVKPHSKHSAKAKRIWSFNNFFLRYSWKLPQWAIWQFLHRHNLQIELVQNIHCYLILKHLPHFAIEFSQHQNDHSRLQKLVRCIHRIWFGHLHWLPDWPDISRDLCIPEKKRNADISANSFRGNYSFLNLALCTVTFSYST